MQWNFYNKFYIPDTAPHEIADTTEVKNGALWKKGGYGARWTSSFDIECETHWWYVIKDTPFDISELKAKRRYEINKGIKNFDVCIVEPLNYKNELYNVYLKSLEGYPPNHRDSQSKEEFETFLTHLSQNSDEQILYAAFHKETNEICGYAHVPTRNSWAALSSLKTVPAYEKYGVNAALVYEILTCLNNKFENGFYICDGQRNTAHQTKFQDYLEKYFSFRKAYCVLNIEYRPIIRIIINMLYPFRKIYIKFDGIKLMHLINSILKMEECARKDKKIAGKS